MAKAWMRVLNVILTSKKTQGKKTKQLKFGSNWSEGKDDLAITVRCDKFVSSMKDSAIVRIKNLTYNELVMIIDNQFFDVEIQCGYRKSNVQTIFKGAIFYVSNELNDTKTNTVVLICTSYMVAMYGQKRLNLSMNSGINMYSYINHIVKSAGITDASISTQLKKQLITNANAIDSTSTNAMDILSSENQTLIINTDYGVTGASISIFDASRSNMRLVKLTNDLIDLSGGYPRLTNEGLTLSLMPTFALTCGDVIQIDNSIINISVASKEEVSRNYGYYLDKDGNYMIMSMHYVLENRGPQFGLNLQCKSRSLISNYIGGN